MTNNDAVIAEYYYDGKNRQIARRLSGEIRFSVWDGWELIEEYGSVRAAAYLQGATGVIKSLMNNVYYYQDKLGSTTHIANASGALLESYRYDLYGTPSYYVPGDPNARTSSGYGIVDLYAGERWIPELGFYDLRNRFMSPELGRFLQADPIGFKGDASNLYRYVGNDPSNKTDPLGLDYVEIVFTDKCAPLPYKNNEISGSVHSGTLRWFDDRGNLLRALAVNSGGYRSGDSKLGKGDETRIPNGYYRATEDRGKRDNKPEMKKDGVSFFIAIEPDKDNRRTNLGFHPDGATPGSHGCPALDADGKTLKEFRQAFGEYQKERGSLPIEVKGENNSNNEGARRPSFDAYGSTTIAAADWEDSWGKGLTLFGWKKSWNSLMPHFRFL